MRDAPANSSQPLAPYRDLAGLPVHDADDLRAGRVFGVLSDADVGLVRFLDIELEGDGRHVLVPVGHTRVEEGLDQCRLRLRAARLDDLRKIPAYDPDLPWNTVSYARELAALHGRFFRGDRYYAHPAYDHRGLYAGAHPIVVRDSIPPLTPLLSLDHSDYTVARNEPDVRGWPLIDANGESMGRVADLIFDPDAQHVRYIALKLEDESRRLLPIGYLQVDAGRAQLVMPGLTRADVSSLPKFTDELPTRSEESAVLEQIERALDARNPFLRVDYSDRQAVA
jgi:hypothetical protein